MRLMMLIRILLAWLCLSIGTVGGDQLNMEVGKRVLEVVDDTMSLLPNMLEQAANYHSSRLRFASHEKKMKKIGFDRDAFYQYGVSVVFVYEQVESVYLGLEDGTFFGVNAGNVAYREPGDSGYRLDEQGNAADDMQKHLRSCVNGTGHPVPCLLQPGESYIECTDGCALVKCPDETSQKDCSTPSEFEQCQQQIKWCKSYNIAQAPAGSRVAAAGFVPLSPCCMEPSGLPSQTPGAIHEGRQFGEDQLKASNQGRLGTCFYRDRVTPVHRNLTGDYAYCGGGGATCNNTFHGCFASTNFDPRYRSWYLAAKALQQPTWIPPYVLFGSLQIGISFARPIYDQQQQTGRTVFAGVLGVDVRLSGLTTFLTQNYNASHVTVAIIEETPPNYVVATSTGSTVAKSVLPDNHQIPCNRDIGNNQCDSIRTTVQDLKQTTKDTLLSTAFAMQMEAGFPQSKLLVVHDGMDGYYASQTLPYISEDNVLHWRIIILSPVQTREFRYVNVKDPINAAIIAASTTGFTICISLLLLVITHRNKREIAFSDWRFTGLFIFGCSLLNAASLSLIAPVSDNVCLVQMWLLHFFFAFTIAPLFAKIYRVYKLVGGNNLRRTTMSHAQTIMIASPIVLIQITLLTIFTFVDPAKQIEIIEQQFGSDVTYTLDCAHNTQAFLITEFLYEGGLVFTGCILAYKTRNIKKEFSEAKQLMFAMYTLALMTSFVGIVTLFADLSQERKNAFIASTIALVTCISSAVFVLPRMVQVMARSPNSIPSRFLSQSRQASDY